MSQGNPVTVYCPQCKGRVGQTVRAFVTLRIIATNATEDGLVVHSTPALPHIDLANCETVDVPFRCFNCGGEYTEEDLSVCEVTGVDAVAARLRWDIEDLLTYVDQTAAQHPQSYGTEQVARIRRVLPLLPNIVKDLADAEAFVTGFEGDELQDPVTVSDLLDRSRDGLRSLAKQYGLTDDELGLGATS